MPNGSATRDDTMLSAAHTHNLSIVMPSPIPRYGLFRRYLLKAISRKQAGSRFLDGCGLKARKIEKLATTGAQHCFSGLAIVLFE